MHAGTKMLHEGVARVVSPRGETGNGEGLGQYRRDTPSRDRVGECASLQSATRRVGVGSTAAQQRPSAVRAARMMLEFLQPTPLALLTPKQDSGVRGEHQWASMPQKTTIPSRPACGYVVCMLIQEHQSHELIQSCREDHFSGFGGNGS